MALVLLTLGVAGAVVRGLRSAPATTPSPPAPAASGTQPGIARTEGLDMQRFEGGRQRFRITSREQVGSDQEDQTLHEVALEFEFTSRGRRERGSIRGDRCLYSPRQERAHFTGNVVVTTEDGFEVRSPSLVYRRDRGVARTEDALTFRRKDVSGQARGAVYHAETGKLELLAEVVVSVRDPDQPPAEVRAPRAVLSKEEGALRFEGGVAMTQVKDVLKAGRVRFEFSPSYDLARMQAQDDVDLLISGQVAGGVLGLGGGGGPRRIQGRKLDVWFRADRTLEGATAGPDAVLTLSPGPREPPERKRLESKFITFGFDGSGRLLDIATLRGTRFVLTPLRAGAGGPQTVDCQRLRAEVEPGTTEPRAIDFERGVVFSRPGQKATSELARYEGATATLHLTVRPALLDERQATRLEAARIEVGTRSGDVRADGDVRQVLERRPEAGGGLLNGRDQATLLTSPRLEYTAADRTSVFLGGALLRAGRDEVRAPSLRLQEGAGGRRLEARDGVVSLLHPQARSGEAAPVTVQGRARQMVYEEKARRVVYTGDVRLRQGDIETKSPAATLLLSPDGSGLSSLEAGAPVEVRQGARVATADRATYDPAAQTMLLQGDKVTVRDATQEVQGRSVVFHVGDDRIQVDGQERGRTETIFRKEGPKS